MMARHMTIEQLPSQENYRNYLQDLPDCGGSKNGHARAIYGGFCSCRVDLHTSVGRRSNWRRIYESL